MYLQKHYSILASLVVLLLTACVLPTIQCARVARVQARSSSDVTNAASGSVNIETLSGEQQQQPSAVVEQELKTLDAAIDSTGGKPNLLNQKHGGAQRRSKPSIPRPDHTDYARMIRWLVHMSDWGVLGTVSKDTGAPVGGVVSHSDGTGDEDASGRVFLYLTPMDESTQNIMARAESSYTLSESALLPNGCGDTDPEDPTCVKVTLLGRTQRLMAEDDVEAAKAALFARHPDMAGWPSGHSFDFYEFQVYEAHLLDWYGGMKIVTSNEYYTAEL